MLVPQIGPFTVNPAHKAESALSRAAVDAIKLETLRRGAIARRGNLHVPQRFET